MPTLELHAASEAERLAAYRNVHDVWGGGLPLEQHVARRLQSVQHNRAEWYVGTIDGRVVTSLAAYPLQFHVRSEIVAGFSIGSVHTLAECRGHGYAPQLIEWVERDRRGLGERIALLYSDISCGYYARLGYVECPAWQVCGGAVPGESATGGEPWSLVPCDPRESLDELASCYAACHDRRELAIARSREYWRYTLAKQPEDEFGWLVDGSGDRRGYLRITSRGDELHGDELRLADFALEADDSASRTALIDCLLRLAAERGRRLSGWLPDWEPIRRRCELQPRQREVTMVKSLDADLSLDEAAIQSADAFCEIDHV